VPFVCVGKRIAKAENQTLTASQAGYAQQ